MRRLILSATFAALAATAGVVVAASASVRAPMASPSGMPASSSSRLTADVTAGRLATAKYATNLARAKAHGHGIITRMIPEMGYHFLNPKVSGFSVRRPAILVYEHHGATWQFGALEWVFTSKPATPPRPGARTAPSARRATTSTAPSCSRARSQSAPRRAGRRAPSSTLAPQSHHAALLDLVSEPGGDLQRDEPDGEAVQQRLIRRLPCLTRPRAAARSPSGCCG